MDGTLAPFHPPTAVNFPGRTTMTRTTLFATASLLTLATVATQALRAASTDPVEALRYE